jgi:hypothetical protein
MYLTRSLSDVYAYGGVVGTSRNLKCYLSAAAATSTWTCDEIILSTGLGQSPVRLGGLNLTLNLSTTGAGGMDTGAAPASGFVGIYIIYNPTTQVTALLATNATSASVSEVYGGANMPSGFTASALVSVWPTNSSSQLKPGLGKDRNFYYQSAVAIFTATTGVATLTLQSIAAGVPFNGKGVTLAFGSTATGASPLPSISSDSVGTAANMFSASNLSNTRALPAGIPNQANIATFSVLIVTAQTIYWMETNLQTTDSMYVLSYVF